MMTRVMSFPRLFSILPGALALAAFASAPAAFAANTLTVWGNAATPTNYVTGAYDYNTSGNWGAGAGPVPTGAGNIAQLTGSRS